MKKLLLVTVVLLMTLGGVFVYTNPTEDELRKEVEFYLTEEIEKDLPKSAVNDDYASNMIHLNLNQSISISEFYFFKKVYYSKDKKTEVIGYGYFNKFHGKK